MTVPCFDWAQNLHSGSGYFSDEGLSNKERFEPTPDEVYSTSGLEV
jgi:hypothetical protein